MALYPVGKKISFQKDDDVKSKLQQAKRLKIKTGVGTQIKFGKDKSGKLKVKSWLSPQ